MLRKNKYDHSWFNLGKYKGLRQLDIYGWERQLSGRKLLKQWEDFNNTSEEKRKEKYFFYYKDKLITEIIQLINLIKINPILNEEIDRSSWGDWALSDTRHPYNTNSVFSTEIGSSYLFNYSRRFDSLRNPKNNMDLKYADPAALNIDRGVFLSTFSVMVDLSATDEQIKKDFAYWLSGFRKESKITAIKKKLFNDGDFNKWVNGMLLPYFDLTLIAKFEGSNLTNNQIAKILFDDLNLENPGEKVGRTTKRNANEMMRSKTLLALQAQIRSLSKG